MKCKGKGGEITLAGTKRIFAYTRDMCRSVHDSVKMTVLDTLPKQNWEVNHILVNPASYFIALRKHCIPCSTASMPWFPLWATVLSIAHRKCCEAGVNCSFSNPCSSCVFHFCSLNITVLCTIALRRTASQIFVLETTCCSGNQILGCTHSM